MELESKFNNKVVLVLGGLGFIGSNFIRSLFQENESVVVISFDKHTYSGNPANLDDIRAEYQLAKDTQRFIEIKGDIAVKEDLAVAFAWLPDYVINFAAETHVDRSIHTADMEFINTNVVGVFNILEAVKNSPQVVKYLQVSTDEVYGQLTNPYDVLPGVDSYSSEGAYKNAILTLSSREKFNRSSPFKPNVPYSATKASGDCMCNAWNHTWHVPVVVSHCSNNYGPYQYPEKMLPYWASKLLKNELIPIYGDGLNIRDWIHVDDHVIALKMLLLEGEPGKDYLIGADNERTNLEMAQMIIGTLKPGEEWKSHIEFVTDRPGHDRRYAIDASDITRELGWQPKFGQDQFLEKLIETLQWYSSHTDWMQEIITRTGVANAHIDLWKAHPELQK